MCFFQSILYMRICDLSSFEDIWVLNNDFDLFETKQSVTQVVSKRKMMNQCVILELGLS